MKIRNRFRTPARHGKILLMTAILLPALMAFMALGVDLGIIAASKAQLQTVADAASLAGAMKLADENRVRGVGTTNQSSSVLPETSASVAMARSVGQANLVLNSAPVIHDNSSNAADGDVVVGYFNPTTHVWAAPPLSSPALSNAVLVNASRTSARGSSVPGFFSRVWTYAGTDVKAQSIAVAQNYPINGFKAGSTQNAPMIPITLDYSTYQAMMNRTTTDNYSYDSATNTVSNGPDNIYESHLYPNDTGSPGSWGTLVIGTPNNGTSDLVSQILYGITPQQIASVPGGSLQLQPSTTAGVPPSITFNGNPGISAGMSNALTSIIGKPVVVPIYDVTGLNGANAFFRIVALQTCRIVDVNFSGNPKYVVIQPCLLRDSTAIANTNPATWPTGWSWQSGGVVRLHLAK